MAKLHYKIISTIDSKHYELKPLDGQQKSFYGKATIEEFENGDKMLYSYNTPIVYLTKMGVYFRLWSSWSQTTSKHIEAFLGKKISKKKWLMLENCIYTYDSASGYSGWGIFSK